MTPSHIWDRANCLILHKRGVHDIEKKLEFKDNKLFIVHDSEGFEAGQENEFEVVVNFIRSRSLEKNLNDRLHAIWSVEYVNDRGNLILISSGIAWPLIPDQFNSPKQCFFPWSIKASRKLYYYTVSCLIFQLNIVPIVAIFTKFDLFVEDQVQELMENAEDPDILDEGELERQAAEIAMEKFERHYKGALLKLPYPPQAIVAVSNS